MRQKFDYTKLRKRIREKGGMTETLAQNMGFTLIELSAKLDNAADFTLPEMDRVCDLLNIGDEEVEMFFFSAK